MLNPFNDKEDAIQIRILLITAILLIEFIVSFINSWGIFINQWTSFSSLLVYAIFYMIELFGVYLFFKIHILGWIFASYVLLNVIILKVNQFIVEIFDLSFEEFSNSNYTIVDLFLFFIIPTFFVGILVAISREKCRSLFKVSENILWTCIIGLGLFLFLIHIYLNQKMNF